MDGWEGQNWLHRDKGKSFKRNADRTKNIIALRSWGDGEVLYGTQADVSTLRHVKHGVGGDQQAGQGEVGEQIEKQVGTTQCPSFLRMLSECGQRVLMLDWLWL